jgi:hypothetical protein
LKKRFGALQGWGIFTLNWVSPSVSLIKIFGQLLTGICVKLKTCQKHATTLA